MTLLKSGKTGGSIQAVGGGGAVGMFGTGCNLTLGGLGHVICFPCCGRFMWPLAVPGHACRYFDINFSVILGHPLRKPFLCCFQQCRYVGITQRLMCKFDGAGSRFHQVPKGCKVNSQVDDGCHQGRAEGTIFTGGGLWQESLSWDGPHLPVWNR